MAWPQQQTLTQCWLQVEPTSNISQHWATVACWSKLTRCSPYYVCDQSSRNKRHYTKVGSKLVHRLRRCPNIEPTLSHCLFCCRVMVSYYWRRSANTRLWANVVLKLARRLRRRSNIKTTLVQRLSFAGDTVSPECIPLYSHVNSMVQSATSRDGLYCFSHTVPPCVQQCVSTTTPLSSPILQNWNTLVCPYHIIIYKLASEIRGGCSGTVVKDACLESRRSRVRTALWHSCFKETICFFPAYS